MSKTEKTGKTGSKKTKDSDYLKYPSTALQTAVAESANLPTIRFVIGLDLETDNAKSKKSQPLLKEFPYFKGANGETVKSETAWYVGLGSSKDITPDSFGECALNIAKSAAQSFPEIAVEFDKDLPSLVNETVLVRLTTIAFSTAIYPVDLLKSAPVSKLIQLKKITLIPPGAAGKETIAAWKKDAEKYARLGRHVNAMRQLQALPGNYANPETVEKRARNMAKEFGLKIRVFQKAELEKMGAGGILSVGRGSSIAPRMIVLEYDPKKAKAKTLALVGKGVTFDSGGISIKPSSDMHEMKYDMSGAAAVLHGMAAIAEQKLPVKVVGAIGLVENMPDGDAIKPGDVYRAYNGVTIEVQNTDAEGRLVLGDLLSYVSEKHKPDYMVNLATLTGACVVALGYYYAGLFANGETIESLLKESSVKSGEPVWSMPMGPLYQAELKSDIADFNNIGGRYGGASSAASFLSIFVDEKIPWAHIDVAGIAFLKKGFNVYQAVGTGFGVRLLSELAETVSAG